MSQSATRKPRKRGDGEGSIRWSEMKKLWIARIMLGYRADGKPDVRKVTSKTRGECQRKLDDLRQRLSSGILPEAGKDRGTVGAFLRRWVETTRTSVRPKTYHRYGEIVTLHLIPGLGRHRLAKLRPDHVETFYAQKLEAIDLETKKRRWSPRTVHHCHRVLYRALEMAVRWGYLPRNVCDAVTAPKVPRREIVPPTPEEIGDLRHANGTAMLRAGIHPKAASARLGHSSIGITMDLYTHAVRELDAEAAAKLDAVFARPARAVEGSAAR